MADYWSPNGWRPVACPIHRDEHPSAGVAPDSAFFRCLGCGFEGDIIALSMAVERKSFEEVVTWLEDMVPPSDTTTSW